jgi:hypothetical protein
VRSDPKLYPKMSVLKAQPILGGYPCVHSANAMRPMLGMPACVTPLYAPCHAVS